MKEKEKEAFLGNRENLSLFSKKKWERQANWFELFGNSVVLRRREGRRKRVLTVFLKEKTPKTEGF